MAAPARARVGAGSVLLCHALSLTVGAGAADCGPRSFPTSLPLQQCPGLARAPASVTTPAACVTACCTAGGCSAWNWCGGQAACSTSYGCWIGVPKGPCIDMDAAQKWSGGQGSPQPSPPAPGPAPPPSTPAPLSRWHCDKQAGQCVPAATGHSALEECKYSCTPSPGPGPAPATPTPPAPATPTPPAPPSKFCLARSSGVDCFGETLGNKSALPSPEQCCNLCDVLPGCTTWTYYDHDHGGLVTPCYFKSGCSSPKAMAGVVSGGAVQPVPPPPTPRPTPPATPPPPMPDVTGAPCSGKYEQNIAYNLAPLEVLDLATLPSPLNTDDSVAGRTKFCCLYCVRDSRCNSWTLRNGRTCTVYNGAPGNKQSLQGAVSGNPLPRVPNIPSDPQGSISCLSSFAGRGKYQVRRQLLGTTASETDKCPVCWASDPDNARYLLVAPVVQPGAQKMPVYIWMAAEGQPPGKYGGALEHIASHGFVVLAPWIDYSRCHSNLCSTTGNIYWNYATDQRFACQGGQCVPSDTGTLTQAQCPSRCGKIQPPAPNATGPTCTVEQVNRGESAVRYVLQNQLPGWARSVVDATLPIAIGGASATAPAVLKVVAHLADDVAAQVGAVVLQHPSYQPSHTSSLDSAFQTFARRAKAGGNLPAVLAVSGYMCERMGSCAAIIYNKACRTAAAANPPDEAVLATCGDCTDNAGRPVAWGQIASRYGTSTQGKGAVASVAGPWHHWAAQSAGEVPIRIGCGSMDPTPETSVVIAWLSYALRGDSAALTALRQCARKPVSAAADPWLLGRLDEDRLRNTPAGRLIEQAIQAHGKPLQVPTCNINKGRIESPSEGVQINFTGSLHAQW